MRTYHLTSEIWLPCSKEAVFRFFADPHNLERITPPWLHFEILSRDLRVAQGTLLDYRLRVRGIPLRWQSEISLWDPPHRFIDRQTKGPYSFWLHEHWFRDERGGTRAGDHVEYAALGGPLIQQLLIQPDLDKIFSYRRRVLEEIFASDAPAVAP